MLSRYQRLAHNRLVEGYVRHKFPSKFDNVIVAMSSGVDSSVAAALFAGFPNARGVYMQNWSKSQSLNDPSKELCYERDWKDVCKVGSHLNFPVERVNFEQDYWIDVFEPMLKQYECGYTPNPDIGCNRFVKFGKLREHLDAKLGPGNYWLVTGHYARVMKATQTGEAHLLRSFYPEKDQSYYLSQIPASILPQLLMPVGDLTKPEVRQFAHELQIPTADKPDSQGICFVGNSQHGKFNKFLEHYLPSQKGNIITIDPESAEKTVWGEHEGIWSYTVGQKVGISMPQGDPRYQGAWYVGEKLLDTNEIVIVRGRDHPVLYRNFLELKNFMPLGDQDTTRQVVNQSMLDGKVSIQYRSLQTPIRVKNLQWNAEKMTLLLEKSQRAMAPGQYCCVYINDRVLGSGIISSTCVK
ncbi:LAFE_0E02938g1_1 [Lachancea fermentati]|uniref:tRNA-5-taurinomethyluridine 2-sulfurtransferase n=1 Tax=Lachancea fermentati TaxID=4955 RepID=A0A1G4MCS4_LACFM|nr:LAFE_0E02938g1_1 [Lachancea fermentati]